MLNNDQVLTVELNPSRRLCSVKSHWYVSDNKYFVVHIHQERIAYKNYESNLYGTGIPLFCCIYGVCETLLGMK